MPRVRRIFPATAVLLQHNGDIFLFDTGYSSRVLECGWRSYAYNLLNPMVCRKCDCLQNQLSKDGIKASEIKGIILSHLHPDHIGGLKDFPGCEIYISKGTYQTLKDPTLLDIIFDDLIPQDFETRLRVLDLSNEYDLFGDNSLMVMDISGHTNGQLGIHLPEHNIFLAADSCWGADLTNKRMRSLPKRLQKDYAAYQITQKKIQQMQADGIQVIFSHEV